MRTRNGLDCATALSVGEGLLSRPARDPRGKKGARGLSAPLARRPRGRKGARGLSAPSRSPEDIYETKKRKPKAGLRATERKASLAATSGE